MFLTEGEKIRLEFDKNASLNPDSWKAQYLIRRGTEKLHEYTHPDPYIRAYMPGGSLFMRNPPLPLDQCYPLGIPEDVKKEMGDVELDIDCIPSRDGKGARIGKRLVDSANKTYY